MADMKEFPPYDEKQWQADDALRKAGEFHRLVCPDCDFSGDPRWYGPHDDKQGRHYRACKKCGFWQEADGTSAYRCWMAMHLCEQLHPTAWILTPKEDSYLCQICETWIGREHAVPWPEALRR